MNEMIFEENIMNRIAIYENKEASRVEIHIPNEVGLSLEECLVSVYSDGIVEVQCKDGRYGEGIYMTHISNCFIVWKKDV